MIAIRTLSLSVIVAGMGFGTAFAQEGITPEKRDLLVTTIEQNGCSMSEEQAETLLPPLGFTPDETAVIAMLLVREGRARLDVDTLTLTTENCR